MKNKKTIKRIGIDARFYGPLGKGLGRYTKEVVDRVIQDENYEYVVFLCQENFADFEIKNPARVKKVLANVRWYTMAEQIFIPWYIWREKIDLMHFPHFNVPFFCPTRFIVTIHDLILTKFPTQRASTLSPFLYKIKNFSYEIIIKRAAKRSKKIIAVSEFTKDDIIDQFKIKSDKIVTTYEGVYDGFKKCPNKNDKNLLSRYNIESPFLLYVGNAYPHKNLEGLVRVFSKIKEKKPDLSLVLVGKEDYFYKRIKDLALKNNYQGIVLPGYVPDDDLVVVFGKALAYVFPSLYEGFGLPPLEAMMHGCPVVSSNKASMPEILGDAALYFNPDNEVEMQQAIEEIINNQDKREDLINRGFDQVKKYSWDDCAEQTIDVYNEVLNK